MKETSWWDLEANWFEKYNEKHYKFSIGAPPGSGSGFIISLKCWIQILNDGISESGSEILSLNDADPNLHYYGIEILRSFDSELSFFDQDSVANCVVLMLGVFS